MSREKTGLKNQLIENGHEMEVRVYYEDTDFSGVVYHSNYLKYMERSRTEWLRHLEIFHTDLEKDDSAFAIHRMTLKFGPPAVIDDLLIVRTTLQKLTGARSFLRQEVLRAKKRAKRCCCVVRMWRLHSSITEGVPSGFWMICGKNWVVRTGNHKIPGSKPYFLTLH